MKHIESYETASMITATDGKRKPYETGDRDRPFAIATLRYVDPHCSSGTSIPGATEHALIFLSIIE